MVNGGWLPRCIVRVVKVVSWHYIEYIILVFPKCSRRGGYFSINQSATPEVNSKYDNELEIRGYESKCLILNYKFQINTNTIQDNSFFNVSLSNILRQLIYMYSKNLKINVIMYEIRNVWIVLILMNIKILESRLTLRNKIKIMIFLCKPICLCVAYTIFCAQ